MQVIPLYLFYSLTPAHMTHT